MCCAMMYPICVPDLEPLSVPKELSMTNSKLAEDTTHKSILEQQLAVAKV